MFDRHYPHFVLFIGIFLLLTIPINCFIHSAIENYPTTKPGKEERTSGTGKQVKTFPKLTAKHLLIPEDPTKYNITVQREYDLPANQAQWDMFLKKNLAQSKNFEHPLESKDSQKGLKTPRGYTKQRRIIEERIKMFEKQLQKNPEDRDLRERLQILYMLKSTLNSLEIK